MYARSLLALILFSFSATSSALEVTACASDTQAGAGTNLKQAIAAGGVVTFRCAAGTRLLVADSHSLPADTVIDGGGAVTLVVRLDIAPAFVVGANQRLTITRLRLEGDRRVPGGRTPGITTVLVGNGGTAVWRGVLAQKLDRPMFVMQSGRAILEETSFSDGPDPVRTTGDAQLEVRGGRFERMPGAIYADGGRVTIAGTRFTGSRLVLNHCELQIADATFSDNDVRGAGLSGGALDTDCKGLVTRTLFQNNRAVHGGAVNLRSLYEDIEFQRVRFIANQVTGDGGAIHREAYLALIRNPSVPMKIRYSVFRTNSAANGGAIFIGTGPVEMYASHFAENAATGNGGAIFATALRASRVTLIRNRAGQAGGAIHAYIASHPYHGLVTSTIANALIVQNEAPRGAGIYGGALRLVNSTVADNTGPGVDAGDSTVTPAITLTNSLFVTNTGGQCQGTAATAFAISGPNLQNPGTSCPGVAVADPYLDPVYAPVAGSPALGAGDMKTCLDMPVNGRDALGEPRPQGRNGCTIGAIENAVERQIWNRLIRRTDENPADLISQIRDLARHLMH